MRKKYFLSFNTNLLKVFTNIKTHILLLVFFPVMISFFMFYSYLNVASPLKFTSPDENVNLFFSNLYSNTGKLQYEEPLNSQVNGYLRPRNAVTKGNTVLPSGFTGIFIIFGTIGAIAKIVPFITPIISIIGVIFVYLIGKTLFNEKVGIVASVLILFSTPYWFWSSMTMFNNLPASVFFVGGIAFLLLSLKEQKLSYYVLTSICFSLNQFFRFTDIIYFLPLLLLLILNRKSINYKYVLVAIVVYVITILPIFILNKQLFGSPIAFGYSPPTTEIIPKSGIEKAFDRVSFFFLPSGFNPTQMTKMLATYIIFFTPITFITCTIAVITALLKREKNLITSYTIFFIAITAWILSYYGSGIYWGNNSFSMDASYIRYFLPIYILATPLCAYLLTRFGKKISILALSAFIVSSIIDIHSQKSGITDMLIRRESSSNVATKLLKSTENNAIIFTTLSDKNIFPERKVVIYGPGYDPTTFNYSNYAQMINNLRQKNQIIYVFNDRNDLNIDTIKDLLAPSSLTLRETEKGSTLYKVIPI